MYGQSFFTLQEKFLKNVFVKTHIFLTFLYALCAIIEKFFFAFKHEINLKKKIDVTA